jgi:hypothetical protein
MLDAHAIAACPSRRVIGWYMCAAAAAMNNPLEGVTGLPEEQKRKLEDAIEQMQVRDR